MNHKHAIEFLYVLVFKLTLELLYAVNTSENSTGLLDIEHNFKKWAGPRPDYEHKSNMRS